MDINILEFYRVFAVIGFILIVKQIVFLCNKPKNSTYFVFPFWICASLWLIETALFVLVDIFGKPDGLNIIESKSIVFILYVFLFVQVGLTVLLYIFSGKYAEYHIIYNAKKRKQNIDLEKSYIVLYGLLKFKRKKIFIRDINVEDSSYVMEHLKSKLFPYAAILGSKEYLSAKLTNGTTVNIGNKPIFLSGETYAMIKLTKVMGIKYIS